MTTAFTVDSKNVANRALFIYCICYITPIPMYLAALQKLKTRINKIRLYPVAREMQLFCQEKSQEKTTQRKRAVEKIKIKWSKVHCPERSIIEAFACLVCLIAIYKHFTVSPGDECRWRCCTNLSMEQKLLCRCPKVTAVWKKERIPTLNCTNLTKMRTVYIHLLRVTTLNSHVKVTVIA